MSKAPVKAWTRSTPPGGVVLAFLLAMWLAAVPEAGAQGAAYVEAYNVLVSNLNHRLMVVGSPLLLAKNGSAGDAVRAIDVDNVRKKVRDLMLTMYSTGPAQWDLSVSNVALAFPAGLRYANGVLVKPSLMEGVGDGEGRFTKIPGRYTSGGTNVYAETFKDEPILWDHIDELDRVIRKLRYMIAYKGSGSGWVSLGAKNTRSGWAAGTNWTEIIGKCNLSYDSGIAMNTVHDFPAGYSSMVRYDAVLERRMAAFMVGGLNTSIMHRVHYFIIGSKPALSGGSVAVFHANGDPISEGQWYKWCEAGPTYESAVVSTLFGSFAKPAWGGSPQGVNQSWKGYNSDMRAMVEWEFPDHPVKRPTFEDNENDGLLDAGCTCRTCPIEMDTAWRDAKVGAEVMIPLGFSDGTLTGGLRVKAYLAEFEMNGCTQQMYSLDSRVLWRICSDAEGWDFASIKRPSGAEILFSLKGRKPGKPVDLTRKYEVEDRNGGIRLKFTGKRETIYHEFLAYPGQNGRLARVGVVRGTNDVYTENASLYRGQWPGLVSGYGGPFYGNPVVAFSDCRLDAVLSTNSGGLVRQVEYRYKSGGPTNRVVYYVGSKGFRVIDEHGVVIRDVRLVGDHSGGSQEVWTGITTNTGLRVARKEKRRQWFDSGRDLLMVEQTDVINEGQPGAASNVTLRALRTFDWGEETVEETLGAGTPDARTVRLEYYSDRDDTNNYGRLSGIVAADGGWTHYTYDSHGREHFVRRGTKSAPVGALRACRETEYGYAGEAVLASLHFPVADQVATDERLRLVVEREDGCEISRTYHSYQGDSEITVRCVTPGALYDEPSNLVASRTHVMNGLFKGRPARVVEEDGSLRVYAYDYNSGRKELTTVEDSGTGVGDVVTNGTRRVTVLDAVGSVLSESGSDIATGIEVQGRRFVRDGFGRETVMSNTVDGSVVLKEYGCCGPVRVCDEGGVATVHVYDELKRVYASERLGVSTFNLYDVFGNVVESRRRVDGMPDMVETSAYDHAGRLVRQVDAQGAEVVYAYGTNALGEAVVTTTQSDGSVSVETSYLDGRTKCVTGTAVRALCYDYGADGRGRFTVEYRGADTNTAYWVKTWQDMLGRTRWVEYADGYTQETLYDGAGRAVGVRDGFTRQVTEYNGKGEAFRSGVDLDGDGVLAVGGSDRMTEVETGVGVIEGMEARWSRNYAYAESGSAVRTLMSESWQSLDGTRTWSIAHGSTNRTQVVRDAARATREEVTTYPDGTRVANSYTNGLLKTMQRFSVQGDVIARMTYEHDGLGRTVGGETAGPNSQTIRTDYQFDVGGKVTGTTTRAGSLVRSAGFRYDEMGRRTQATLADGTVVRYSYKPTGELARQAGSQTVPVEYDYDGQGRMVALSTFRDGEGGEPDVTRWLYDERRGWVNGKVYADGTTTRYEYRQDGRLERRESARGIETRYGYDAGGVMTNTVYSDGTPGVGVVVDRLGRAVAMVDAMGARGFRYDVEGALVEETLPGGAGKVEYGMDVLGRRTNLVVSGGAAGRYGVGYGYDEAGRLAAVAGDGMRADYTYAADGVSVAALRVTRGGAEVVRGIREYDDLGFLRAIDWVAGTNAVAGRAYGVNALGQRTRCGMGDGAYWEYCYDELGQLTSAGQYTADGRAVSGRQYEYAYDTIGNRSTAVSNGVVTRYTANGLNQYERWEGAGGGSAAPEWQGSVYRFGGSSGGQGKRVVGKQADGCKYDMDGNMTSDGVWCYAWDAENRLMMVSNAVKVLRFGYDYKGRRTVKKVYTKSSDSWVMTADSSFIYDGWNVVREVRSQDSESRMNQYVWGLDLSGTVGGAGGIGGLVSIQTSGSCLLTPVYDGNGNVTALVDTNGAVAASYEYDPFGNLLSSINHQPLTSPHNPFTFSTKYCDEETGLSYYGYRYYSPGLGRWLSRDPMEESGGVNLYGFCANSPADSVDSLGLALYAFDGTWNDRDKMKRPTNVAKLHDVYAGLKVYLKGVGTEWHTKHIGGATGAGGGNRIRDMYNELVKIYSTPDAKDENQKIDVIGFSRGAALARTFVNYINSKGGVPLLGSDGKPTGDVCPVRIRFLGLFDTVASFGWPGNDVDWGQDLSIPANVENVRHATALDEKRGKFPLSSVLSDPSNPFVDTRIVEAGFSGVHSDIGGGYEDGDRSNLALMWMHDEGVSVGVPFGALPPGDVGVRNPVMHDERSQWAKWWNSPRKIYYPNAKR